MSNKNKIEFYNFLQLKPGDYVYARRVDADKEDFKIYKLKVIDVRFKEKYGTWINHDYDVDWGHIGTTTGNYTYYEGYVLIEEFFYKNKDGNSKFQFLAM